MSQTAVEKILSRVCGRRVKPGEVVLAHPDLTWIPSGFGLLAIKAMQNLRMEKVQHPDRAVTWLVEPAFSRQISEADYTPDPVTINLISPALDSNHEVIHSDEDVIVTHPNCSMCAGLQNSMEAGEICISSSSRNFKGRMGHPNAKIFVASPATVAASAVRGRIADPRNFLEAD